MSTKKENDDLIIQNGVLLRCSNKKKTMVAIPEGVTEIGEWGFSDCSSLTSVIIPDSVEIIEAEAFAYCTSLSSVEIPNRVKKIGNRAFYQCPI